MNFVEKSIKRIKFFLWEKHLNIKEYFIYKRMLKLLYKEYEFSNAEINLYKNISKKRNHEYAMDCIMKSRKD